MPNAFSSQCMSLWIVWFTADRIIAIATAVYAVVTAIMSCFIYSQAKAARRQADIAERTAQAAARNTEFLMNSERAHVDVEFTHLEGTTSWDLCVTNHGRSLAYLTMCTRSRHHVQDVYRLPDNFRDVQRTEHKLVLNEMLPPGRRITLATFEIAEIALSESEKAGNEKALVRGSVTYDDISGRSHETEVIYEYRPPPVAKLAKLRGHSQYK